MALRAAADRGWLLRSDAASAIYGAKTYKVSANLDITDAAAHGGGRLPPVLVARARGGLRGHRPKGNFAPKLPPATNTTGLTTGHLRSAGYADRLKM